MRICCVLRSRLSAMVDHIMSYILWQHMHARLENHAFAFMGAGSRDLLG